MGRRQDAPRAAADHACGPRRPDAALVCAALDGDRAALAELLLRHWKTAAFLASRVLGSADLGHDAAQEAAVAAITNLDRLRSPDRFGAWFCGIALNVARRWLRQLHTEVPALLPDLPTALPGPAEAAEMADLAGRVRAAIDQLPDGQREAVLLFYLQGLSHLEVAGELGISRGAVKARLHQARAALAPRLAPMIDDRKGQVVTTITAAGWVDAHVSEIRRTRADDPTKRKHIMILAERGGERTLPIWIGPAEATALALTLASAESPRPFTYKLASSLVTAAGSVIAEVRITRLVTQVFYATVIVDGPGGHSEVDARPSDAVNLALVAGVPIKIESELFNHATPAGHAKELESGTVATADLAAEAQEMMREALAADPCK